MVLYAAYLSDNSYQPATISSYMSAIKYKLIHDGEQINEDKVKLASIIRTSRIRNRRVVNRMPISRHVLKQLLDTLNRKFQTQPYLRAMYRCMCTLAYFGMLRVGEITKGTHPILAADVHMSTNRKKIIQLVLRSSKTHVKGEKPQIVRIPNKVDQDEIYSMEGSSYCPFTILQDYLQLRGKYKLNDEPFFVFSNGMPVRDDNFRRVLKATLKLAHLQNNFYSTHSFRAGRADDLRTDGVEIQTIQKIGRWKSEGSLARYFM